MRASYPEQTYECSQFIVNKIPRIPYSLNFQSNDGKDQRLRRTHKSQQIVAFPSKCKCGPFYQARDGFHNHSSGHRMLVKVAVGGILAVLEMKVSVSAADCCCYCVVPYCKLFENGPAQATILLEGRGMVGCGANPSRRGRG